MSNKTISPNTPTASRVPAYEASINHSVFDTLPDSAYVRQLDLLKSIKNPAGPIPFSPATLWRKVKNGTFPKTHKLSERVTAFNVGAVRAWMRGVQA